MHINEYFEPDFDAAAAMQIVFQQPASAMAQNVFASTVAKVIFPYSAYSIHIDGVTPYEE